jgi:hypothetical protein
MGRGQSSQFVDGAVVALRAAGVCPGDPGGAARAGEMARRDDVPVKSPNPVVFDLRLANTLKGMIWPRNDR